MKKQYIVWLKMFYGKLLDLGQIEALAHAMMSEFGAMTEHLRTDEHFEFVIGGRKSTKTTKGSSFISLKHKVEFDGEPTALMRLAMVMQDLAKVVDKHGIVVTADTLPAGVRIPAKKAVEAPAVAK